MSCKTFPRVLLTALIALASSSARSEGTAEMTGNGNVLASTQLLFDIVDASTERIRWQGTGSLQVRSPSGTRIATLNNN